MERLENGEPCSKENVANKLKNKTQNQKKL